MTDLPADWLARLRALDTPIVSDALDALSIVSTVAGLRPLSGDVKVAGRVVTVELIPAGSRSLPPSTRHLATAAVAAAGPGDVIVVAHPGGLMAGWGGLLTKASSLRGVEGTLIDGPARDVDESRALSYPIYARQATPITARGRLVEGSWGEEIAFAGVTVRSGDLVLADGSGVTFLPADRAAEVLERARAFADRESAMAADLDAGLAITEVMGKDYEELLGQGQAR